MRRLPIGTKIFLAILVVSLSTMMGVGVFVYSRGCAILQKKARDELSLGSLAYARYLEHHLEDTVHVLRHLNDSEWVGIERSRISGPRKEAPSSLQSVLGEAHEAAAERLPWVVGVGIRTVEGRVIAVSKNRDRFLPARPPYPPFALLDRARLVVPPHPTEKEGRVECEIGISSKASPGGDLVTVVVDLSELAIRAPIPERVLSSATIILRVPGSQSPLLLVDNGHISLENLRRVSNAMEREQSRDDATAPSSLVSNEDFLWARAKLPKLGWDLIMWIPAASTHLPLSEFFQVIALGIGAGTVLALFVSFYLSSVIVRPIKRLTEAFREFSKGNWDVRVPVTSSDEIGELTDGFNEGVRFLASQHDKLRRFRALVHHSQDAVLLYSAKGGLVYANPAAYSLLGYERREDLVLRPIVDIVCPRYRKWFQDKVWPRILEGRWEGELHLCRSDARRLVAWVRAGKIPSEKSQPEMIYAAIRDISDRKATEKALKEAEEYYRTLFRSSQDAIVVTDPKDVIIDVNEPGFSLIFGYRREEVLGRPVMDLRDLADSDADKPCAEWKEPPGRYTVRWKRKDGHVFVGETTVDVLEDARGERRGYLRVIRDVSEWMELLEKLEKAYRELKSLDELKDRFLAGVSHDLRTPLIPVRAFLERLLQGRWGPLSEKQKEFLRYCLIGVNRELILVEELLDYTRLQSGKLELHPQEVDLQDVVRSSLFLLYVLAETNRLRVSVDMPEGPVMIRGDYNKLLRIFNNLFSNAVKYNRPEGEVRVRGHWVAEDRFCVEIEDTGVGIPKESLSHIFEHFYRVDMDQAPPTGGAGIGLAVVRELVRLHGATLDVRSTIGVGSVFSITFPVWSGETSKNACKRE